ncbi:MAG: ribonuclease Z [Candidatus Omnitrophota bacterium]
MNGRTVIGERKMGKIRVVFLGTNGWYTTGTGNTLCVMIETADYVILMDAGDGIHKLDRYIDVKKKPVYIFLSHFHLDHISGFHIFNKYRFGKGVTICCYRGGAAILDHIVCQPYTMAIKDLPFSVKVVEMDEGEQAGFPFGLKCGELKHSSRCFGYRFDLHGKVISLCTDSGLCDTAVDLAKGADVLMTECALKPGEVNTVWPHMNPQDAARLAKDSGARKLFLVHFDAENYRTMEERQTAEDEARKIFPAVCAARDDMEIEI